MQVIATAGHVDHGKSALVRALTGMEPDRWAEEQRRGLTIDLGFAWLTLPDGQRLALVDVPGHERFVPNMLAGVGPVPAVLFVVAADGGWMPQSAEHLAAIDALGISHGLVAVTRADLADPGPASSQARAEIGRTSLGEVPVVAVSAVTGQGLDELRAGLAALAAALPAPSPDAPVRLWVDRAFSVTGAGPVVTGTLPAGTLRTGDELLLTPAARPVRVRGLESLNERAGEVTGVARVAVNLRGAPAGQLTRGMALITPGAWTLTTTADVRLMGPGPAAGVASDPGPQGKPRLPQEVTVHLGSSRTIARVRPLGAGHARLTLRDPLPLHVADRLLLRDPGAADTAITGAVVLDPAPPGAGRRGWAARAHAELSRWPDRPTAADLVRRHRLLRPATLAAMGVEVPGDARLEGRGDAGPEKPADAGPEMMPLAGWLLARDHASTLRARLAALVAEHAARDPLAAGLPVDAARAALGLPDRHLVESLAASDPRLSVSAGYLTSAPAPAPAQLPEHPRYAESMVSAPPPAARPGTLPQPIAAAVETLRDELAARPFHAPEAGRLRELGLDRKSLAAAERAGLLLRLSPEIVLAPGADTRAAAVLAGLAQPFSTAQARQALDTTRRVAIPLLEYLDRAAVTERLPDDRRRLRS